MKPDPPLTSACSATAYLVFLEYFARAQDRPTPAEHLGGYQPSEIQGATAR